MMVLMTDSASDDVSVERALLTIAGIQIRARQCADERDLIEAGAGCIACISPAAPVTRAVLEALPELKLVTSRGESLSHIDVAAAKELGVWVANVPAKSAPELEDKRRISIINVLSWLTHGTPTNVVVKGR